MSLVSSPRIHIFFLCITAASFFLSSIRSEAQNSPSDKLFKFSLAAVAKVSKAGGSQIIPLSDNIVLKAGSLIKFYLELESEGYIYLFHEGSSGELVRLFPQDSQSAIIFKYTPVYVPEADSWIELDSNTGKETFHLIVSKVRLDRLEILYNQHVTLNEKSKTTLSLQAILDEIKALKRPNLGGIVEKPIRIAGKLRGNSSDNSITQAEFKIFASEITTTSTYIKRITIDHK